MPVNLGDLEEALTEVDTLLVQREAALDVLKTEVDELRIERAGLERAVARRQASVADDRTGDRHTPEIQTQTPEERVALQLLPGNDLRVLSRTDASLRLLSELGGEATIQILSDQLKAAGRQGDDAHALGAALSYLAKVNKVHNTGRGRWKLGPKPSAPDDLPPVNRLEMKPDLTNLHRPDLGGQPRREVV